MTMMTGEESELFTAYFHTEMMTDQTKSLFQHQHYANERKVGPFFLQRQFCKGFHRDLSGKCLLKSYTHYPHYFRNRAFLKFLMKHNHKFIMDFLIQLSISSCQAIVELKTRTLVKKKIHQISSHCCIDFGLLSGFSNSRNGIKVKYHY